MRNQQIIVALFLLSICGLSQAQTTRPARSEDEARLNGATLAKLDRVLPKVKFDKVGLSDVFEFLKDVSGVKIDVPWDKMKTVGVDKNKAVSLSLDNEKFGDVLSVLLVQAAGKPGVLGYTVEHGDVVIVLKGATTQPK